MVWLKFIFSAVLITAAATQLAKYGDVIAVRTKISGMFIGVLLLAGATSLPELLTSISSIKHGEPNLAAGNVFGSNTINMLILAVVSIIHSKRRILRKVGFHHALSGSIAIFLIGLAVFSMMADIDIKIAWIGIDSLILITAYIIGVRIIEKNSSYEIEVSEEKKIPEGFPPLWKGILGFSIAVGVLVFAVPLMVNSADEIAEITGIGTTFIGTVLVALVTSLPEMVTTFAAIQIGANDMAIGNLYGSNMFNMFVLGLTDIFFTSGRFLDAIDPSFLLVGMAGLLMTCMAIIGNLAKIEKRFLFFEIDAVALIFIYFASMLVLYHT